MTGKKLQVFYDMDNTLFEMSKHLVNSYSGRIKSYGSVNGVSEEEIVKKLKTEGFFAKLKPIQNSQTTLRKLQKEGYEIGIISQPMITDYCIKEKNGSLEKYFPFIDRRKVTYTFDKYLLAGTGRVLIDDHIGHLEKWEKMGGTAICFIRGYNKKWKGLKIKKHQEIYELLEKLEKECN